jgi:SSS family transporter
MGTIDWLLVAALFALTSWVGHRFAGKPATIRDFFLGGRRLPWYAVAGSIVATEISAVTLVGLPAAVFGDGGNLTYLQLGLFGSLAARTLVAWILVPAFLEREIYSPYDYIGARLGEPARRTVTVLFSVGGVLGQGARVYLTGLVLEVMLARELAPLVERTGVSGLWWCVAALGLVAVLWTWMGGMATVIWTDLILFFVFLAGTIGALAVAVGYVDGGAARALELAGEAGKLQVLDFSGSPARPYTFWAALLAQGLGGLGAYGTDQLMAQRIFCCRDVREARRAVMASYVAMLLTVLVGCLGLALYAYYQQHPLQGQALSAWQANKDRIFPLFVQEVLPSPLKGLVLAGLLAAAVSSLDSILAALSQTTLALLPRPESRDERRTLALSRRLVVGFGLLLCTVALVCERAVERYGGVLNLALAMPLYTQGSVLACFWLAFLRLRVDARALPFAAAISVSAIVALAWRGETAQRWLWLAAALCFLAWLWAARRWSRPFLRRTAILALGLASVLLLPARAPEVSWVWNGLIGCAIAFLFATLLGPIPPGHRSPP